MGIDISKLLEIIRDPDLKIKINDLYGENIKLKEENYTLRKRLDELEERVNVKSRLVHEGNHYFLTEGDKRQGPYCTKCWDSDNKLIRLHKGGHHNGLQYFSCPNCKTSTNTGTYIPSNDFGGVNW